MDLPRRRAPYTVLLLLTIVLGLASRHFSYLLPGWLAKNAGDVLYATMAFWLAGMLFPHLSTEKAACSALAFCCAIEFAKFIQAPWLIAARRESWGHLVLGSGFHVSNLVCYALGVLLGVVIEQAIKRPRPKART